MNRTKKWRVQFCNNITAADTFQEHSHQGPTQEVIETHLFNTYEEALEHYQEGKNFLRFAGGPGHYYTFPVEVDDEQV